MIKTVPLKKNYEFLKLFKKGRFHVGRFLVLYVIINRQDKNRIGITVSKKIGKSVKRNRLKRLIRENYRLYENFIKDGCDCLFVVREFEVMPEFSDIRREMKYLLKKMNVFNQEKWECLKNS